MLTSIAMTGQDTNKYSRVANYVAELKAKVPQTDHAALESRMQALINDPDADENDVILILRQEFGTGPL